jgi:hypothetical protein
MSEPIERVIWSPDCDWAQWELLLDVSPRGMRRRCHPDGGAERL